MAEPSPTQARQPQLAAQGLLTPLPGPATRLRRCIEQRMPVLLG